VAKFLTICLCWMALLAAPAAVSAPNISFAKTISVVIRPYGMEPAQVSAPAGRVYIALNNRSTARQLQFSLQMQGGSQVNQIPMTAAKTFYGKIYTLTPGTYLLTETAHPAWVCRIVVAAN